MFVYLFLSLVKIFSCCFQLKKKRDEQSNFCGFLFLVTFPFKIISFIYKNSSTVKTNSRINIILF